MLERDIQRAVVLYARSLGCIAYKFSSDSNRAVPDYLFLFHGRVWFIEFKAPHVRPTKAQLRLHVRIREHGGIEVHIVDNVEVGIAIVDRYVHA